MLGFLLESIEAEYLEFFEDLTSRIKRNQRVANIAIKVIIIASMMYEIYFRDFFGKQRNMEKFQILDCKERKLL